MCAEKATGGAARPNQHLDRAITFWTTAFVGVAFLVDVNSTINIATVELNAKKFTFLFGGFFGVVHGQGLCFAQFVQGHHLAFDKKLVRDAHGLGDAANFIDFFM